jgi:hypothetical protein
VTSEKDLWFVDSLFNTQKYILLVKKSDIKNLRKVGTFERKVGEETEWKKRK